ncbi:unnamed protein product [Caenorhabditis angaria]|uniref:Uncharacterized protein n=1 Tax=Caenorhabditis angaria TaxID=860376 RepID=A0A9P1IUP5_9PELO|nr:unnamed protein product [Caenorhabditis angaria]
MKTPVFWLTLLFVAIFVGKNEASSAASAASSRQAAVNRAIEQTKSRQSAANQPLRVPQRVNSSPGKSETIDVEKLNRLIRSLDKTWILPKTGSKDPIGSNFQYKKTCASIYKARHGACQQLGFGVMCFNYCHERGEKLSFKCQDTSDATYCKQSGTFDTFLAKYRKDGYKAKAYIHQMISRCYATTICNTQSGILNSTIIDDDEIVEKTTKANRLNKMLTRKPSGSNPLALMKLKTKITTTTSKPEEEVPEPEIPDDFGEEEEIVTSTTAKRRINGKKAQKPVNTTPRPVPTTTTKANIWDKFTVGMKAKPTPKYIPFWQRLMSTTIKPVDGEGEASTHIASSTEEEAFTEPAEVEEEEIVNEKHGKEEKEVEETVEETTTNVETTTIPEEDRVVTKSRVHKTQQQKSTESPSTKHTFKPQPVTVPQVGPELAHQKPNDIEDLTPGNAGFWNTFQPNRWFESIHYVTNTGK